MIRFKSKIDRMMIPHGAFCRLIETESALDKLSLVLETSDKLSSLLAMSEYATVAEVELGDCDLDRRREVGGFDRRPS
jgi:hypothetical protein